MTSRKQKKLGRGFKDLYAQNESDLPFLDIYGEAAEGHGEGLPDSTTQARPEEILAALARHLKAAGCDFQLGDSEVSIGELFRAKITESGVRITLLGGITALPLVPSDLMAPGFSGGELSVDRKDCTLNINSWSASLRHLLDRLVEHWSLREAE